LVAQAVEAPMQSTVMGMATKNLRNISILLIQCRA
jgi:hypothetical protein